MEPLKDPLKEPKPTTPKPPAVICAAENAPRAWAYGLQGCCGAGRGCSSWFRVVGVSCAWGVGLCGHAEGLQCFRARVVELRDKVRIKKDFMCSQSMARSGHPPGFTSLGCVAPSRVLLEDIMRISGFSGIQEAYPRV